MVSLDALSEHVFIYSVDSNFDNKNLLMFWDLGGPEGQAESSAVAQ